MALAYRERERDWDDYSRRSDPRSSHTTIKRYVIPAEEDRERDVMYRRDDTGDRELVIRRTTERNDPDYDSRRYERDYRPEREYYDREYNQPYGLRRYSRSAEYIARPEQPLQPLQPIIIHERQPIIIHEARGPIYVSPREEPDYQVVQRSDVIDRDPRDREYYYQRRVREYEDERTPRRELSPHDSVSQVSRDRRDRDYSSDDSMVYIRKETRDYDGSPHHRRHLAEGALVGVGAAELFRHHNRKEGDNVSGGWGRLGKDVGAGALGAVAADAITRARSRHRSKSRRRSESVDWDRGSRHHHRHRSRHRSRSASHSRAKTLAGIGLGAAALAGAVALARNKSTDGRERRSRSRHRRASSPSEKDAPEKDAHNPAHRNKRMAEAGLAGAAVAGLIERHRSKSRSRKGERSRSRSIVKRALPVIAAGLGSAAAAGLYEKNKAKKEEEEVGRTDRRRSRSRSKSRSGTYPDPTRDSAGLIEYGDHPVYGNIPAADYYGQPPSPDGYYSDAVVPAATGAAAYGAARHGHRSRSRGDRYTSSSSDSDRSGRRRHRHKDRGSRSRSRHLAEAALAAAGGGYVANQYAKRKERKKTDNERRRYDSDRDRDPYEDSYDPEPYTPPPPPAGVAPQPPDNYYDSNSFPPPPGSGPIPNPPVPYNPADYPPPPGAAPPPQQYGYQPPPGPEPYAPRPRRADDIVSAAPFSTPATDVHHIPDGLRGPTQQSSVPVPAEYFPPTPTNHIHAESRRRSVSQPAPPTQPKTVAFDLDSEVLNESDRSRNGDPGYETDDSDSTIDGTDPRRSRRRSRYHRRASISHPPTPHPGSLSERPRPSSRSHKRSAAGNAKEPESDSTIDLPDRFDSEGHLLPQRGDDPLADHIEELLKGIGSVLIDGRSRR